MTVQIRKAIRQKKKSRIGIFSPSGGGKTYGALVIASGLVEAGIGNKILVIDTEDASADLYSDKFDYSVCPLESTSIEELEEALKVAKAEGFDIVIIDSYTHFWNGDGGILQRIDEWSMKNKGDSFRAWAAIGNDLTKKMIKAVTRFDGHMICTMRQKKKYLVSEDSRGKKKIEKIGAEPQIREGIEFEFDVVAEIDLDHNFMIEKTRCDLIDGKVWNKIKKEDLREYFDWLNSGAPQSPPVTSETTSSSTTSPELAVDEPTPQEIDKVAGAIITEYGLSQDALLVWVPRDLDALTRYARLTRIYKNLQNNMGKMSACALGAYHEDLKGVDLGAVFTGAPENEVAEHTALCKAINLRENAENPQPLIEYIKAQFESKAA